MSEEIRAQHFVHPASLWPAIEALAIGADRDAFLDATDRNRLINIAAHDLALPDDVRAAAMERFRARADRELARLREQQAVLATIQRVVGPCIALKGADLGWRLYPDPRLRPMNDVDVLAPFGRRAEAVSLLMREGFTLKPRPESAVETVMRAPGSDLLVDVYERFAHPTSADVDVQEIFAAAQPRGDGLLHLSSPHAIVLHALTMAKNEFVTHVRKYLDLWLLLRDEDATREAITTAQRWNVRRALWSSLHLLARLFLEVANAPWQSQASTLVTPSEARHLERFVLPARPTAARAWLPVHVWRKLGLLDTASHRCRFFATSVVRVIKRQIRR